MRAVGYLNELCSDAYVRPDTANAALNHVANAEVPADIPNVRRFAFVGKTGIPGRNAPIPDAYQEIDEFLGHAIGEIFLVLVV